MKMSIGIVIEYPPNINPDHRGSCVCLKFLEIQVLLGVSKSPGFVLNGAVSWVPKDLSPLFFRSTLLTLPTLTLLLVGGIFMQHYIEIFESWIGGIAMSFNALTFPAITYLQICKPKRMEQRISAFAICSLGMVLPLVLLLA